MKCQKVRIKDGKRLLAGCLVVSLLFTLLAPGSVTAANDIKWNSFGEIMNSFKNANGRILSAAHRSDWRNAPENSLPAIQSAIDNGIDMVEMDVKVTSDGHLILMHDHNVDRMTNGTGDISSKTLTQIRQLRLREGQGGSGAALTEVQIPTFEEALDLCKGKILINLDHANIQNGTMDRVWELTVQKGCEGVVVLKSDEAAEKVVQWLDEKQAAHPEGIRPMFAMLFSDNSSADTEAVKARFTTYWNTFLHSARIPEMIELVSGNPNTSLLQPDILNMVRGNTRLFFNFMWSDISAGRSDDPKGWNELSLKGFNVFQTDYSAELASYLKDLYLGKEAEEKILATHFSWVDDISQLRMASRNAIVLQKDQTVKYSSIDFSSTAIQGIQISAGAINASTTLSIYVGGTAQEYLLTEISVSPTGNLVQFESGFQDIIHLPEGVQDVYIQTNQAVGLEFFRFYSQLPSAEFDTILPVTAYVGIAPALPARIAAKIGEDTTSIPVKWEYIAKEKYQSAGTFEVNGRVAKDNTLVKAIVTVQAEIPELPSQSDILSWFSASDLELQDGETVKVWKNKVAGAADAVLTGGAPVYYGKAINGAAPAVVFDGIRDVLKFTFDANGRTAFSTVLVNAPETAIADADNYTKLPTGAPLYFHESGSWGQFYIGAFSDYVTQRFGAGENGFRVRGFRYKRESPINSYTTTIGVKDSTQEFLYIDGHLAADTSDLLEQGKTSATMQNIALEGYIGRGGWGDHQAYYKGSISEILFYNRALKQQEVGQIQAYMDFMQTAQITEIPEPQVITAKGVSPSLPESVELLLYGGKKTTVTVNWDPIEPSQYEMEGTFTVTGSLEGYGVRVQASVSVSQANYYITVPANTTGLDLEQAAPIAIGEIGFFGKSPEAGTLFIQVASRHHYLLKNVDLQTAVLPYILAGDIQGTPFSSLQISSGETERKQMLYLDLSRQDLEKASLAGDYWDILTFSVSCAEE